ncbi:MULTISPECIES: hypothetical protein [Burkholderia]|uniref:hypothetical protein n=1 Tax=Burkholderia TaxID=32008 RepID=UPI000E6533ED|nr:MULTISPECIES: hypothetical protein [Burkholderia]MCR5891194.1 hypothetical protein [Burkholderia sp. HAN2018]
MDVGWFLHERVNFIRQLYKTSAAPYAQRKDQIERGVDPFEPPYSEDGEPPFQVEWQEADDSLHVLGYSCVSMLSDTLKIFFDTWKRLTGLAVDDETAKVMKKRGFVAGYCALFETHLGVHLDDSGIDLELLEQVVLVRNRVQHQNSLTMNRPSHSTRELARLKSPFFLDEFERNLLSDVDMNRDSVWLMAPRIAVTGDHLMSVLDAVDRLADWMDEVIEPFRYRRNRRPQATL